MKRFKLPKKAAHIGAWIMPNDIIDDICEYWNNPENDKIIYPLPGRVVIFESQIIEHEVNPVNTKRLSITGSLKTR